MHLFLGSSGHPESAASRAESKKQHPEPWMLLSFSFLA
jgi:hypothetical protein